MTTAATTNLQDVYDALGENHETLRALVDDVGEICPDAVGWVLTGLKVKTQVYIVAGSALFIIRGAPELPHDDATEPRPRAEAEGTMVPITRDTHITFTASRAESLRATPEPTREWTILVGDEEIQVPANVTAPRMDPTPFVREMMRQIARVHAER